MRKFIVIAVVLVLASWGFSGILFISERLARQQAMGDMQNEAEATYLQWRLLNDTSLNCEARLKKLTLINGGNAATLRQIIKLRCDTAREPLPPVWRKLAEIDENHSQDTR